MIWILLIAAFLGGIALGMLALIVVGIHREERHVNTAGLAHLTHTETATRRVLGVCVRKSVRVSDCDETRR